MKFLFYISKKYSIPIIQPLVESLKEIEHEFSFFVSEKVNKNIPDEWKEFLIMNEVDRAINYHSDFVIVPGNFVDPRIPGIKVQIFHGLGIEKKSHFKIRHFFDVYCTSGPFVTGIFLQLKKKYKYFNVVETGWPKVDHILRFSTKDLKKRLSIPNNRKVILFAPTHSKKMESASELMSVIPKIIRKNEFWLIKFHELMNKELVADFKNKLGDNAKFLNDYDITPYLHIADVLISDTSSVIYEFMLLDKPVITYKTQSRFEKGLNILDPTILRDALDWSLQNPGAHSKKRKAHLMEINPYLKGNISENLIRKLIERKQELAAVKKPLNIFRKLQILYHERFKKGYLR